ncbi:MAG TPA: hypothetical protein VMD59_05565, partial [Acidimicrobiales bacterium]|nr:hypothetical protein [Acidimicrobiales bacterium]
MTDYSSTPVPKPSFGEDQPGPEFRFSSLSEQNRIDIVNLSANFAVVPDAAYVAANTLELTALGANTDLLGQWSSPDVNLVDWHHIAVTGRDVYVKIVTRGWMFPLGHQAALLQIAERDVLNDPTEGGWAQAFVGIKFFIRIIAPTKLYPAPGQPFSGNDWPVSSVEILTTTSPELDPEQVQLANVTPATTTGPKSTLNATDAASQALLLTSAGSPVIWTLKAIDLAGNIVHLQVPLAFVHGQDPLDSSVGWVSEFVDAPTPPNSGSNTYPWVNAYNNNLATSYKQAIGHGQMLRFSPEAGGPAGGTTHPLVNITLGASRPYFDPTVAGASPAGTYSPPDAGTLQSDNQPAFYPIVANASVRVKAADALSGSPTGFADSQGPGMGVNIQFFPDYVVQGLPEGDPQTTPLNGVYAQLTDAVTNAAKGLAGPLMQFPGNLVGGLGLPNMAMAGLSSIVGPVGGALSDLESYASYIPGVSDATQLLQGFFNNPGASLQKLLPQLFGSLKLTDILSSFLEDLLGGIPNLTVTENQPNQGDITISYQLSANTSAGPEGAVIFVPGTIDTPKDNGLFTLQATIVISLSAAPTYDVEGSIDEFVVYLVSQDTLGFIAIPFNGFKFSAKTGSKTVVDPSVGQVQFIGALSFVNTLEQFLQDLGGSGLSISVTPTEVDASFALSLPPVAVGVFTLSGIAFSTAVTIPFLGDPALLTFGFASQDNPFTLTVCMFGGGGFLALGLGFAGVQTVQASFEFEGNFSLDIGIASGGISLQAGIYYA